MKSQLKLVVCASKERISVNLMGLRSLPGVVANEVDETSGKRKRNQRTFHVKVSLYPDRDEDTRLRFKSNPLEAKSDSITFHETASFDLDRESWRKRLLISCWSKNDESELRNFIGCMSFRIKVMIKLETVQGWYYLLPEAMGRRRHLRVQKAINYHARVSREQAKQSKFKIMDFVEPAFEKKENEPPSEAANPIVSEFTHIGRALPVHVSAYDEGAMKRRSPDKATNLNVLKKCRRTITSSEVESRLKSFTHLSVGQSPAKRLRYDGVTVLSKRNRTPRGKRNVFRKRYSPDEILVLQTNFYENLGNSENNSYDDTPKLVVKNKPKNESDEKSFKPFVKENFSFAVSELSISNANKSIAKKEGNVRINCKELAQTFSQPVSGCKINESFSSSVNQHYKETGCNQYQSTSLHDKSTPYFKKCSQVIDPVSESISKDKNIPEEAKTAIKIESDDKGYHSAVTSPNLSTSSSDDDISTLSHNQVAKKNTNEVLCCSATMQTPQNLSDNHKVPIENKSNFSSKPYQELIKDNERTLNEKKVEVHVENLTPIKAKTASKISTKIFHLASKSLSSGKTTSKSIVGATLQTEKSSSCKKTRKCKFCELASLQLIDVIKRKDDLSAFRSFLVKEYCEENLDFWLECQVYRQSRLSKRRKIVSKIVQQFLAKNCPKEINIDEKIKRQLVAEMYGLEDGVFDDACNHVFELLKRGSFLRFQKEELKKCVCSSGSENG